MQCTETRVLSVQLFKVMNFTSGNTQSDDNSAHVTGTYHIAMTYLSLSPYASTKLALSVLSGLMLSFAASSLPFTGVSGINTSLASHLVHSNSMQVACESRASVRCHRAIADNVVAVI
jgi:hypothetical protein